MKYLLAATIAAFALVIPAAPAHADQYDYVSALDNRGIPYSDISQIIDTGKMACANLRRGIQVFGPQGVGAPITAMGYSGLEAAIITVEAVRNMCPDQTSVINAALAAAGRSDVHI